MRVLRDLILIFDACLFGYGFPALSEITKPAFWEQPSGFQTGSVIIVFILFIAIGVSAWGAWKIEKKADAEADKKFNERFTALSKTIALELRNEWRKEMRHKS